MMAYALLVFMLILAMFIISQEQPQLAYAVASTTREHLHRIDRKIEKMKNVMLIWGGDPRGDAFNDDPFGIYSPTGNHPGEPYNHPPQGVNSPYSSPSARPYRYAGDPRDPMNLGLRDLTGTYSLPHGNSRTPQSYYNGHLGAFIPGYEQGGVENHVPKGLETGKKVEHAYDSLLSRTHANGSRRLGPIARFLARIFWWFK